MSAIGVEGFVSRALCLAGGVEFLPTPKNGYAVPRAIANADSYQFGVSLSLSAKAALITAVKIFVAHDKLDSSFNVRAQQIETGDDAQNLVQDADEAMGCK